MIIRIIRLIRSIRIIRMMIPWHLGNFNSHRIFKSNQYRVSPTLRALITRFLQVSSPTLKGKHCLLTSFVKGAGIMQGVVSICEVAFGHPQPCHLGDQYFIPSWSSQIQSSQKVPEVQMTMLETRCDVDCTILSTPSFPSIGTCTRRER